MLSRSQREIYRGAAGKKLSPEQQQEVLQAYEDSETVSNLTDNKEDWKLSVALQTATQMQRA
jgi:hypothetical protein